MKKLIVSLVIGMGVCFGSEGYCANIMVTDSYSFTIIPDTTAPTAVANLSVTQTTQNTVTLSWTASGDDAASGTAASYDLRYSTAAITEANWAGATQATGEPTPLVAGTTQTLTISGLTMETKYYFAIKVSDEVPNVSALSNVVNTTTIDSTAPAAVANLAVSAKTYNSATLGWTAPGDNGTSGTAASYDVRYAVTAITEANWASAAQATGEPAPAVAGTAQTMTISGLSAQTTYYFAVKATDESANVSGLSNVASDTTNAVPDTTPPYTTGHVPAKDANGISTDSNIIVHVQDDGAGVDVSSIVMTVNGVNVTPVITGTAADYLLTYDPTADFITGQQVFVTIQARDLAP